MVAEERRHKEAETWINEAIDYRILAKELCVDDEERERKVVCDLLTFQRHKRESEQMWSKGVARLREQLFVQQWWLLTIALFKVSQTQAFGEFLNRCNETSKLAAIT